MTYEHTKIENLPPETPCVILNLADFCFEPYAFTILTSRFKVLIKLFFHLNEREQTSNKLGISFFRGSQDEDKPPVFAMMYDSLFTFRWQLSAFSFQLFLLSQKTGIIAPQKITQHTDCTGRQSQQIKAR